MEGNWDLFPSEVSRVTCKRTVERPTLNTQTVQGREKLKDMILYISHTCKIIMPVIAQMPSGPDLCIVQAGPNPPSLLTGFMNQMKKRANSSRGLPVLLIYISLEIQNQDAVQRSLVP